MREKSVILGGDAEEEVWENLVETYGDDLKCDVLKASHHGRDSGYHLRAVQTMNPKHVIVSVGKKPGTDASGKYYRQESEVLSTRWRGNISLTIDALGEMSWDFERSR